MRKDIQVNRKRRLLYVMLRGRTLFCKQLLADVLRRTETPDLAAETDDEKETREMARRRIEKTVMSQEIYDIAMIYWLVAASPESVPDTIGIWISLEFIDVPVRTITAMLREDEQAAPDAEQVALPMGVILSMLKDSGGASDQTYRNRCEQLKAWGLLEVPTDDDSGDPTSNARAGDLVYRSDGTLEELFDRHLTSISRRLSRLEGQ